MQVRVRIENEPVAIAHLQTPRLSIPAIAQSYFETSQHYPKAKEYVRRFNDLRLLLLDICKLIHDPKLLKQNLE